MNDGDGRATAPGRASDWASRWRLAGLLLVVLLASAAGIAVRHGALIAAVERQSIDTRFAVRGHERPSPEVALVGLDENSLASLRQYPLSRTVHAEVMARLHADGARAIVYDFAFERPTTAAVDDALLSAAERAAPVVLAATAIGPRGQTLVLGGQRNFAGTGVYAGASLQPTDPDGVIRHLVGAVKTLPTLGVLATRR